MLWKCKRAASSDDRIWTRESFSEKEGVRAILTMKIVMHTLIGGREFWILKDFSIEER